MFNSGDSRLACLGATRSFGTGETPVVRSSLTWQSLRADACVPRQIRTESRKHLRNSWREWAPRETRARWESLLRLIPHRSRS